MSQCHSLGVFSGFFFFNFFFFLRLLDSEIDQTRTELVEEAEEASNRSLSTSVKSSRK